MFANKLFTYLMCVISKSKRCFKVKSSTYYFHKNTKIFANFKICISVPLKIVTYFMSYTGYASLVKIISKFELIHLGLLI